jgi:hypothetical protein
VEVSEHHVVVVIDIAVSKMAGNTRSGLVETSQKKKREFNSRKMTAASSRYFRSFRTSLALLV